MKRVVFILALMNTLVKNPFAQMQKVAVLALCVMMAGSASCLEMNSDKDPAKTILGKWELIGVVGFHTQYKVKTNDPQGSYIEFLSEGSVQTYDSEANEFWDDETYKIDENFIIFNPEKTYEEGRSDWKYKIINNNLEMTHYQGNIEDLFQGIKKIYKRKK